MAKLLDDLSHEHMKCLNNLIFLFLHTYFFPEESRSTPPVSLATCGSTSGVHQQLTTTHGKLKFEKQVLLPYPKLFTYSAVFLRFYLVRIHIVRQFLGQKSALKNKGVLTVVVILTL